MTTSSGYPIEARWRPHTERPEPGSGLITALIAEDSMGGHLIILDRIFYWSESAENWVSELNDEWIGLSFTEFWWVPERELLTHLPRTAA